MSYTIIGVCQRCGGNIFVPTVTEPSMHKVYSVSKAEPMPPNYKENSINEIIKQTKKRVEEIKEQIKLENEEKIKNIKKASETLEKAFEITLNSNETKNEFQELEKRIEKLEMMMVTVSQKLLEVKNILQEKNHSEKE